jgi:diguanylate cyclase (GGDEF)-like protein
MTDDGVAAQDEVRFWQGDLAPDLEAIVDAVPSPFFVLDREGRYLAVLGGANHLRFHDGRSLVGRLLHDVMPAHRADLAMANINKVLDSGQPTVYRYELSSAEVDGVEEREGLSSLLTFEGHVTPVRGLTDGREAVVFMPFNITELDAALSALEDQREELHRLANTDPLTAIHNRRSFLEAARHEVAACRRSGRAATVLLLDLDRFKDVNDSGGHAAGDAVLVRIAELLRQDRRITDVVARLGGEEFAVLLTDTTLQAGEIVAERIRRSVEDLAVDFDGKHYGVTTSIGVTPLDAHDDITDAIGRADLALYRAKREGRNRVDVETISST